VILNQEPTNLRGAVEHIVFDAKRENSPPFYL